MMQSLPRIISSPLAVALVLGGTTWTAYYLWIELASVDRSNLRLIAVPGICSLLFAAGLMSLYGRSRVGLVGKLGVIVASTGFTVMGLAALVMGILLSRGAWWLVVIGGLMSWIGLGIFGLTNLYLRALPRFNLLPLVLAVLHLLILQLYPATLPEGLPSETIVTVFAVYGISWAIMGFGVLLGNHATTRL